MGSEMCIRDSPSGFVLFVIPSVLVSVAVTPILLSISPTPAFDTTKPMSLRELAGFSPLGCVGMFLLGGVFSAQFGMASVYGAEAGLTVAQISIFVATFFVGSVVLQYPIGWVSDRMDRRLLIVITSIIGGIGSVIGMLLGHNFSVLLLTAFVVVNRTSTRALLRRIAATPARTSALTSCGR